MKITAERVYKLGRLKHPNQFSTLCISEPKRPEISQYLARAESEAGSRAPRLVRGERAASSYAELVLDHQTAHKAEMIIY